MSAVNISQQAAIQAGLTAAPVVRFCISTKMFGILIQPSNATGRIRHGIIEVSSSILRRVHLGIDKTLGSRMAETGTCAQRRVEILYIVRRIACICRSVFPPFITVQCLNTSILRLPLLVKDPVFVCNIPLSPANARPLLFIAHRFSTPL